MHIPHVAQDPSLIHEFDASKFIVLHMDNAGDAKRQKKQQVRVQTVDWRSQCGRMCACHSSVWCLTHLPCLVPVSAVTQGGAVGGAFEVVLDEMGPWRRDSSLSFKGRTQVRRAFETKSPDSWTHQHHDHDCCAALQQSSAAEYCVSD